MSAALCVCVCVWLRIAWASRPLSNRTDCPSPLPPQTSKTVVKILPSLLSKPISIWIWTTNLQMVLAETTFAQSTSTCHFWNYKKLQIYKKLTFSTSKLFLVLFSYFMFIAPFPFTFPFSSTSSFLSSYFSSSSSAEAGEGWSALWQESPSAASPP